MLHFLFGRRCFPFERRRFPFEEMRLTFARHCLAAGLFFFR
jgi:hypothetical protein